MAPSRWRSGSPVAPGPPWLRRPDTASPAVRTVKLNALPTIEVAADAVECILKEGLAAAQNRFNG